MSAAVLDVVSDLFYPLAHAFKSKQNFLFTVKQFGWKVEFNDRQIDAFKDVVGIVNEIEDIIEAISGMVKDKEPSPEKIYEVFESVKSIVLAVEDLKEVNTSKLSQLPVPFNDPENIKEFALRIPDYLITSFLMRNQRQTYEILHFLGIVEEIEQGEKMPLRRSIDWEVFPEFFSNPLKLIGDKYQWGGELKHYELSTNLLRVFASFGYYPKISGPTSRITEIYYGDTRVEDVLALDIPIFNGMIAKTQAYLNSGLMIMAGPEKPGQVITGFLLTNYLSAGILGELDFGKGWSLGLSVEGNLDGAVCLKIMPTKLAVEFAEPKFTASAEIKKEWEEPLILIGGKDKSRLELSRASFKVEGLSDRDKKELIFYLLFGSTNGGGFNLVIDPGESDGFIAKMMGDAVLEIPLDPSMSYSTTDGFKMLGLQDFVITINLNKKLGPLSIDTIKIGFGINDGDVHFYVGASIGADLKVLSISIVDIGLKFNFKKLEKGDTSGNLGNMDFSLGIKPPTGVGLAVDLSSIVEGGGYLEFNKEENFFAGVGYLNIKAIGLGAIGVLNTKLENVTPNWALYLNIFSEFPPIPLSFGFFLNGVGGMFCINRTFDDEALRSRLLEGAMDSILFPEDPIKNAPKIIRDIKAVFPVMPNQYIVGAMFKLGWSKPTVFEVDLGVMVEFPNPLKIILLGQLDAYLPKGTPIVEFHMDVFGVINITEGKFSLDAVLRDSQVLEIIHLSGSMAMRAVFKGTPWFLLSIGGFHPDFPKPPSFPSMFRIAAFLKIKDIVRIDIACYFAIGSNTIQFGAKIQAVVQLKKFSVEGLLAMDALIQFVPFKFIVSIQFSAAIKYNGKTLLGLEIMAKFQGPKPFIIQGKAAITIIGIEFKVKVNVTVGKKKDQQIESRNVRELIVKELNDDKNWITYPAKDLLNEFKLVETSSGDRLYMPGGSVEFKQSIAPFNEVLEKYGEMKVSGDKEFDLVSYSFDGKSESIDDDDYIKDWFAPAQYFKMEDTEKLARPSFEEMDGGVSVSQDDEYLKGNEVSFDEEFEEILL